LISDPLAHWIVSSGQKIGIVGVQTLDTDSGASYPCTRPVAFIFSWDEIVTLGAVSLMRNDQGVGIDRCLSHVNRPR
jgi:hypothetical protein